MKRLVSYVLLIAAVALAGSATADDLPGAKAQCMANSIAAASDPASTPEQKAQLEMIVTNVCECVTAKFAAMGDDGAKMLHIMAKMTPDQAKAGSKDPAADKKNVIAILVADYGMSEAEGDAFYERVNPQAEQIGGQCTQDAMQKAAAPMAPSK